METDKLYYRDNYLKTFTAQVISCTPVGDQFAVVLNDTAFYPEGGGQACDLGTLDGVEILDVQEKDGDIVHICPAPLEIGKTVTGYIQWDRRFDLMQQHTGEHIVSGIVHKLFGHQNSGFHIGADLVQVDFDGPIPPEMLPEIELQANEAVWQNISVSCYIPSPEELPNVFYRTKRPLPWPVRIVEVPGYDSCACCGIHVANTGEIGLIKLLSCVKFHQGVRIEMVCGKRALAYMNKIYEQNKQVSQIFSAKPLETGAAARQVSDTLAAEKYKAVALEKQLFRHIARSYVNQENVLHQQPDLTPGNVRELAEAIADCCTGIAAVCSPAEENLMNFCLFSKKQDVKPLGSALCTAFAGRGGGKSGCFQGSLTATEEKITAFFDSSVNFFDKN